jgi:hypothetical protein
VSLDRSYRCGQSSPRICVDRCDDGTDKRGRGIDRRWGSTKTLLLCIRVPIINFSIVLILCCFQQQHSLRGMYISRQIWVFSASEYVVRDIDY